MTNKKRELIEILLDNVKPDDWPEELQIVTRDEFVKRWNERNLQDCKKQDTEGWITWNGGEMPVEKGTLIDVKYRHGIINEHVKAGETTSGGSIPNRCAIDFKHDNNPGDIVAYRIHSKTNTTTPPSQQNEHTEETKPIQQENIDAYEWPNKLKPSCSPMDRLLNELEKQSATDTQVGGDHYTKLAIQPMQYSMKNGLDPLQHTVIKYVTRFRDKAGIEDLEKAKHCIDMLIEFERNKS